MGATKLQHAERRGCSNLPSCVSYRCSSTHGGITCALALASPETRPVETTQCCMLLQHFYQDRYLRNMCASELSGGAGGPAGGGAGGAAARGGRRGGCGRGRRGRPGASARGERRAGRGAARARRRQGGGRGRRLGGRRAPQRRPGAAVHRYCCSCKTYPTLYLRPRRGRSRAGRVHAVHAGGAAGSGIFQKRFLIPSASPAPSAPPLAVLARASALGSLAAWTEEFKCVNLTRCAEGQWSL